MNLETIQMLYDYNYWAHRRVWDCVTQLGDEAFYRPLDYSIGSIHSQLVHTMGAEWIWFSRLQGMSPTAILKDEVYPTHDAVRAKWNTIEAEIRGFLTNLNPNRFLEKFSYNTTKGIAHEDSLLGILIHVVNHGTDHRAQILAMCHQLDGPTVEQDLIFYLRSQ